LVLYYPDNFAVFTNSTVDDAMELTFGVSPSAMRRSMPRRNAPAAAR
jgi:hypothetical protein